MYKHLYQHFLASDPERLHFAAHSHHLWPDVTREAHIAYWDDAAKYIDNKWDKVFGQIIPSAQKGIASILNLSDPNQICFAPNTHEFVTRIISCFDPGKPISILTTDGEFHSFRRQTERLEELSNVEVMRIPVEPFETFQSRFSAEAQKRKYNLIFFSHVFFTSGFVIQNLESFASSLGEKHEVIVIDGYHGFCAIPTNLNKIQNKVFYLSGGYKYAQSGEGACFLHIPKNCQLRPINTGWFAVYGSLHSKPTKEASTTYSNDAFRFWGATFDPSGIYRMNAVMQMFAKENLTIEKIHSYVESLQNYFISKLESKNHPEINHTKLLKVKNATHSHFLTFRTSQAESIYKELAGKKIITDFRGDCLRFGFGLYQDTKDIDELFARI